MEAITSRPLLLKTVAKAISYANQTTPYLMPLHGRVDILKKLTIDAALQHVRAAAEQFKKPRPLGLPTALRQRAHRTGHRDVDAEIVQAKLAERQALAARNVALQT